ncbi:MAG: zf-HC2 domain-containing protein, partial [Thermoanaerobaculia bacterium]
MKDDDLSGLRAAFTTPDPTSQDCASCPEPDRIWEAVRGELPPEEVRDIVDHVAVCASCAEDWRIAVEFEKESARQEKTAVVRSFPARRFQPWIA